ncbi:alpha/beta hydrolase [Sphaerisporangium rhizosphaerae]|uniref:Alpha/beta hydrolase n=1 Tax=Sphaerisporangium rhizosphaerae TaxID=2269375 RepID=A0ABW2PEG7_9ACTN
MRQVRAVLAALLAGTVTLPLCTAVPARASGSSYIRARAGEPSSAPVPARMSGRPYGVAATSPSLPGPVRGGEADTPEDCPADALCGTLRVPLDQEDPAAGTTAVAYRLVYRRDRSRAAEGTILPNPGGPGMAVIGHRDYTGRYRDLLEDHDLLLVDPRGVGRSDPLTCRSAGWNGLRGTHAAAVAAARACGRELGPTLRHYTTAAAADDIDAVRAHLGIDRLDLLGQSYGTYLMTVYARRHPRHVRSIVLSGAYPLRFDMLGRPSAHAMRRALRLLCHRSGGACDGGEVLGDLSTMAARLDEHPARYGAGAVLDETALASTVYKLTSGHVDRLGRLPSALRAGVHGDLGPLEELAEQVRPISGSSGGGRFSMPMYVTIACNDYPVLWDRRAPVRARARQFGALLHHLEARDYRPFRPAAWVHGIADLGDLCVGWPDHRERARVRLGRAPDVPVLVLTGELDTGTPTEEALQAADQYRRAEVIEVPSAGHVAENDRRAGACVVSLETRFIRHRHIADPACLRHIPPVPVDSVNHPLT